MVPLPDNLGTVEFLQIEPTTRCNFNCKFCCGRHFEQTDISYKTFEHALDQLPDLRHIELQGEGEPFLHPRLFDMIRLARNKGIKVSTITNGSLFTRDNINKILDSGINCIRISIETPYPAEFKKIRGGSLKNILKGTKELLKERNNRSLAYPKVGFAVTVLKDTVNLLPKIGDLYNELGMDGGMGVQPLNSMDDYSKYYSMELKQKCFSYLTSPL